MREIDRLADLLFVRRRLVRARLRRRDVVFAIAFVLLVAGVSGYGAYGCNRLRTRIESGYARVVNQTLALPFGERVKQEFDDGLLKLVDENAAPFTYTLMISVAFAGRRRDALRACV